MCMDLNEHDHSGTSTSTSAMTCELAYVPTYGARNTSGYRTFWCALLPAHVERVSCRTLASQPAVVDPMGSRPTTSLAEQIASSSAQVSPSTKRFFYFYILKNIFYRNIFLVSQFTVLYPYRPVGGRQGPAAHCRPPDRRQGPICN